MSPVDARPNRLPNRKEGAGASADHHSAIGAELRARREELGWSLPDVANWLRIRETHLTALEAGQTDALPGTAYAVGFIRTYAQALGLDGEDTARRFKREAHGALERKPELTFPQPVSERGVPVGLWVGAGLAVIVATYVGYYHFSGTQFKPIEHVPPATELMPGVTTKGTTSPQIAAVMPDRGNAPPVQPAIPVSKVPASETGNGTPKPAVTPAVAPQQVVTPPMPPASEPDPAPMPSAASPTQPPETAPQSTPVPNAVPEPSNDDGMTLNASADAWVQVRDQSGNIVLNRVLKAGESWKGDAAHAPYRMTLGNAGGLTLTAGNVTTPPLGRPGAVRKNLVVSPESVRDGSIVSASTPAPAKRPTVTTDQTAPRKPSDDESDRLNARQLDQSSQPR